MKNLIYLASPYSHPDAEVKEQRFRDVLAMVAKLMNEGVFVFSPIAHSHPVAVNHELPGDWQFWKDIDERFITACDEVWVLMIDGWDKSTGVKAEIEIAEAQGKPVLYLEAI